MEKGWRGDDELRDKRRHPPQISSLPHAICPSHLQSVPAAAAVRRRHSACKPHLSHRQPPPLFSCVTSKWPKACSTARTPPPSLEPTVIICRISLNKSSVSHFSFSSSSANTRNPNPKHVSVNRLLPFFCDCPQLLNTYAFMC